MGVVVIAAACGIRRDGGPLSENASTAMTSSASSTSKTEQATETSLKEDETSDTKAEPTTQAKPTTQVEPTTQAKPEVQEISFDETWKYAEFSVIHTASVRLYRTQALPAKGKVVCVNAGHGCKGGSSQYTLCHPDGSPKVTGGSTSKGSVKATSINEGTVLKDGTTEAAANLELALTIRDLLLSNGYDVLMIRESEDAQLDNIARTVIANNNADCHIALHYDSSETDKGFFYISVPDVASYRKMEPVKSHFEAHTKLGESILKGVREAGVKIYAAGSMAIDLTQTSYSTIPSVDLEVGDRASSHDKRQQETIARGILDGLDLFFGFDDSAAAEGA